jgi:acetyl-CoA C-acetyltransferase
MNKHMLNEDWILANKPELYWPMLQTAECRQEIRHLREQQDQYGVRSQQRAAAREAAGQRRDRRWRRR